MLPEQAEHCAQNIGVSGSIVIVQMQGTVNLGSLMSKLEPRLEHPEAGFRFLRVISGAGTSSTIKGGADPLESLARGVFQFLNQDLEIRTLLSGTQKIDFTETRLGFRTVEEFIKELKNNTDVLLKMMRGIGSKIPWTLVITMDITADCLEQPPTSEIMNFFKLLSKLSRAHYDNRLVLMVPTEKCGLLYYGLQQYGPDFSHVRTCIVG